MMTMGFSITPSQLQAAWQQPLVLVLNLVFCFVAMPLVALGVTASLPNTMASSSLVIGTLLMGCVRYVNCIEYDICILVTDWRTASIDCRLLVLLCG